MIGQHTIKYESKSNEMKHIVNSVQLIGEIADAPVLEILPNGQPFAKLKLGTARTIKSKDGGYEEMLEWHSLIAWGQVAERLAKDLHAGAEVIIHGRIHYKKFKADDQSVRSVTEIQVQSFVPLKPAKKPV